MHILYAEDDASTRAMFQHALSKLGHNVTAVETGEELLEEISFSKFDLVITDNSMPGMNGVDVLRSMRAYAKYADLPVIVLSAELGIADTVKELRGYYISKPCSLQRIASAIETVTRKFA